MQLMLGALTPKTFLEQYWQKKPLLIRQGFKHFQDFLSAEELAGLAMEDAVESRIIYKKNNQWHADFGPFESYDDRGKSDWSLVIQALNHWVPEVSQLIEVFDFIPRWRFDDVMTSFATPGGSVGPHIDTYDTFICQGSGQRHWRVGDRGNHKQFAAHPALRHTEAFSPIIDEVLDAGDILYIPPGYPHEGISIDNSMSFSVGYRSDSARDMHTSLADFLIEKDLGKEQIEDPDRTLSPKSGIVDTQDFTRIKNQLLNTLNDEMISQFSGCYLTQSKCELDLPEEEDYDGNDFLDFIEQQPLIRLGGLRCLYFEHSFQEGVFYMNGQEIVLHKSIAGIIPLLCNKQLLNFKQLSPWLNNEKFIDQITQWLKKGYWYFNAN